MKFLRSAGYQVRVVEKWNQWAKVRQDCFGADVLALKIGEPVLAVQCTSGTHHADHKAKLEASGFIPLWKGAGAQIELWSWTKAGPRGKRKLWTLRREVL